MAHWSRSTWKEGEFLFADLALAEVIVFIQMKRDKFDAVFIHFP